MSDDLVRLERLVADAKLKAAERSTPYALLDTVIVALETVFLYLRDQKGNKKSPEPAERDLLKEFPHLEEVRREADQITFYGKSTRAMTREELLALVGWSARDINRLNQQCSKLRHEALGIYIARPSL